MTRRAPQTSTALVLASALSCTSQAVAQVAKSGQKHQGKTPSITITTNVSSATVMEDGLFVANSGAPFDSTPGTHDLVVSARGYVPRMIRVNLAGPALQQDVNLRQAPEKGVDLEIDFAAAKGVVAKQTLAALPSLCAAYNRAPGKVSRDLMLPCTRETVLDDFQAFGRSWTLSPIDEDADPMVGVRRKDLLQSIAKSAEDPYYWQAEELYSWLPGDPNAAALLAYSAASRQDCTRVLQVALEHGAYKTPNPGLVFVRGLCFELAGHPDKAARLYLHLAGGKSPARDVLYHLARVQSPATPGGAVKTLRVCTKSHPAYYPCYEAMAHALTVAMKDKEATAAMSLYHQRTRAHLAKVFATTKLDPDVVNAAYLDRPESFELAAAAAVVNAKPGSPRGLVPVDSTLVFDPSIVKQLLPRLEESTAPAALTPVYALLTRHYPKDPTLWIRLAGAYRTGDRCSEAVEAANQALPLMQEDRRKAALLVTATECLVRLDRLAEAESILVKVNASGHGGWKAHYNLGVVQERLGRVDEALKSFEASLTIDMPQATRARVETKIAHLRGAAGKNRPEAASSGELPSH